MRTIPNKPSVLLEHVSFGYGDTPVLKDLSLRVEPGEHLALLGANGSGKSTLLDLIIGAKKPQTGTISLSSKKVAFVPQRSTVSDAVPITVRDAVLMGRWAERGHWRPITHKDREIADFQIDRLGLTALSKRPISDLSGGQRQRVLIGQALTQQASLLLLDEPEAGLDTEAQHAIGEVLRDEVSRGTTVIIATHDTQSAARAGRCVLLGNNAGGIIADGTADEVLSDAVLASAFN